MSLTRTALCLGAFSICIALRAGTREDLARLDQQVSALDQQVQQLSAQMAQMQRALLALTSRLDAVERSAQTADLRTDIESLKRQSDILASQIGALQSSREGAPATVAPAPQSAAPPPAQAPAPKPPPATASRTTAAKPAAAPPAPPPVSPDIYNQAYSDYIQGKYDLAAGEFRDFMQAFPSDPRAGNSLYWIGECQYSQKRYAEARDAFQSVVAQYPLGNKALAARLKLGLTLVAMDDTAGGIATLKALVQSAPNSDEALIAKDRLSKLQAP